MADGEIILYRTEDGRLQIQLKEMDGSVWLSQAELAELFETSVPNISQHIRSILQEGELPNRTVKSFLIVRQEGEREVKREIAHYNLEMILAIGYRVRSPRGTEFRQWATATLTEYLVKGFAMNDERLKDPRAFDYFDELLERIREIRASEKRFYQKVKEIYATAVDYDPRSDAAQLFFKTVQNKMIFAVTGQTAAELILARANAERPNMGLTTWKGGRVRKQDVTISKNYLDHDEVSELNRIVTMYLDFAEDRARRRKTMTMAQWAEQLDRFLEFNEREVLDNAGSVSSAQMKTAVEERYAAFDAKRREAERLAVEEEHVRELEAVAKKVLKGNETK